MLWTRAALVVLALTAALATDLAGTLVYRKLTTEPNVVRVRSPVYHHDLKPLTVATETWGPRRVTLHTNSLGFKDGTARSVPLRGERHRLVFIGDSFTEGVGLDYEDTFVGMVDARLAASQVEVLNAAVASYSPLLYLRKVRHLVEEVGLTFDELVVYVDISDVFDEMSYQVGDDGAIRFDPSEKDERLDDDEPRLWGAARIMKEHTTVFHWCGRQINRWRKGELAAYPINWKVSLWTIEPELSDKARQGLERARAHMDELAALTRREGIELTVAVYPWPDQIYHRDHDSRQQTFWRAWAASQGAFFVDHFPSFVNDEPPMDVIDRYFIAGDIHWNRAGHERIAAHFMASYGTRSERPR